MVTDNLRLWIIVFNVAIVDKIWVASSKLEEY